MPIRGVIFDWGGTLTPWHDVDLYAQWYAYSEVYDPENAASLAVAEKIGYRKEGHREKYLHIDGDWRDHVTYILLAGDLPDGLVARLRDQAARRQ